MLIQPRDASPAPVASGRVATCLTRVQVWMRPATFAALATFVACAESPNPVVPTSAAPTVPLPTVEARIIGWVYDSAFRPVGDAAVELTDRAQAWGVTTTDADGRFEFKGSYTYDVTLRATKAGFVPSTDAINLASSYRCCDGRFSTSITLAPAQNLSLQPGPYTVTFDATGRACAFVPEGLRTQTFDATLSVWPYGAHKYWLNVDDGHFNKYFRGFLIGVAGEDLGVAEDGWMYWQPSPLERFEVSVNPGSLKLGPDTSTLRVPAAGYYCEFNTSVQTNCSITPAAQVVVRGSCDIPLTLTPR